MGKIIYSTSGRTIHEYYDEKDSLIQDLTFLARQGNYVFRGYSKQDQLLPNIIREKDLSPNEKIYLNEFEKYGSHYFVATNPLDFLSYAQHYGLPTRLLDFTYNPFIALSFALFAKKGVNYKESEDRDYYYIRYCDMQQNILIKGFPVFNGLCFGSYESDSISDRCYNNISDYTKKMNNSKIENFNDYLDGLHSCDYAATIEKNEYISLLKDKIAQKRLCFIDANQSNQRIIMQQGLFMLPYILNVNDLSSQILENTNVIKVNKSLRGELLEYLDTLGFNTFRLMPDLPNVCAAITQKVADQN